MVYASTVTPPPSSAADTRKKQATKTRPVTVTLQVSGKLWNRSLVMRDTETGSLWSHILGECMEGPLKGARLEIIPGQMMTWKGWKELYPDSTVLNMERTARRYEKRIYRRQADFLYGLVLDGNAAGYPFDVMARRRAMGDTVAGKHILVTFDPETTAATAFYRHVGKKETRRVLSFQWHHDTGVLTDVETGSTWNPETGRATKGELKGERLTPVPGLVSFTDVWKVFHPESRIASTPPAPDADADE